MTVGIKNISTSFSKPDVQAESFSIDLIAAVIFPPIPDILVGDDISVSYAVAGRFDNSQFSTL